MILSNIVEEQMCSALQRKMKISAMFYKSINPFREVQIGTMKGKSCSSKTKSTKRAINGNRDNSDHVLSDTRYG